MATITVTAKDSASAMEDIFEQLGEDAYIIETSKKNGKVSMQATNDSLLLREKLQVFSDFLFMIPPPLLKLISRQMLLNNEFCLL